MNALLYGAIAFVVLALCLFVRVIKGPNNVDRAVAAEAIEVLGSLALVLFALWTGRGIFIDIAIVVAIFSFISSVLIARYLEDRL